MADVYQYNENGTYQALNLLSIGPEQELETDYNNMVCINSQFKIKAGKEYGGRRFWGLLDGRVCYTYSDKPYSERGDSNWPECEKYIFTIETKTAAAWLRRNATKELIADNDGSCDFVPVKHTATFTKKEPKKEVYSYNDLEEDIVAMLTAEQKQKIISKARKLQRSESDSWGLGEMQAWCLMEKIDDTIEWTEIFRKNRVAT